MAVVQFVLKVFGWNPDYNFVVTSVTPISILLWLSCFYEFSLLCCSLIHFYLFFRELLRLLLKVWMKFYIPQKAIKLNCRVCFFLSSYTSNLCTKKQSFWSIIREKWKCSFVCSIAGLKIPVLGRIFVVLCACRLKLSLISFTALVCEV